MVELGFLHTEKQAIVLPPEPQRPGVCLSHPAVFKIPNATDTQAGPEVDHSLSVLRVMPAWFARVH